MGIHKPPHLSRYKSAVVALLAATGNAVALFHAASCEKHEPSPPPQPTSVVPRPPARLMTAEEREDIAYIRANTKPGAPYRLNLADPRQHRHVMNMLKRGGETPERSPALHRLIAQARAKGAPGAPTLDVAGGAVQDLNYTTNFDLDSSPETYRAVALSSVAGGTKATNITVSLYDVGTGLIYATSSQSQYGQGQFFQVPVSGTVPAGDPNQTTGVVASFTYQRNDGSVGTASYYADLTVNPQSGCMAQPNYCVRNDAGNCLGGQYQAACTNTVPNSTAIQLCYYRGSQQECDYYNQAPAHPTNYVLPLSGSVQFNASLGPTPGGAVQIILDNPVLGGGCYMYFQNLAPLGAPNWSVDGGTLSWAYDAAAFPNDAGCMNYDTPTQVYMIMNVYGVPLQTDSGPPVSGGFTFTSDRSQIGNPGVYIVPPINVQQGCFAEGTRVRMADGRLEPIERLSADTRDEVRSGSGAPLPLAGMTSGVEPRPMVRLRSEKGHDLLVTETHPIVTARGVVMAKNLRVGDVLTTEDGPAALAALTREEHTGKVYNLRIGEWDPSRPDATALYANGILAGDMRMQGYHEARAEEERRRIESSPEEILKRIGPAWREDFERHQGQDR